MRRLLPWLLFALAACEPREGPVEPTNEATPPVSSAPPVAAPSPVAAPAATPAPAAAPTPAPAVIAAPAAATPAPAATGPLKCGEQQCGATQICIEAQVPAPKTGGAAPQSTFTCADSAMKGAGFKCEDPKDRRQKCIPLAPGAH
jgi:hypothetical protein